MCIMNIYSKGVCLVKKESKGSIPVRTMGFLAFLAATEEALTIRGSYTESSFQSVVLIDGFHIQTSYVWIYYVVMWETKEKKKNIKG